MYEAGEHAGWMSGVGGDLEVEVLWFFIKGGREAARLGDCHGKIHEVACSGKRGKFPLEAMPLLHGMLEGKPLDGVLFRRLVG